MRNRFARSALALTLALLLAAAPAAAQDADGTRFGVGVSISGSSNSLSSLATEGASTGFVPVPSVLVPIDVSETLRIEPVVGYTRLKSTTSVDGPGEDFDQETSTTVSLLSLGAGVFAKSPLGNDTNLYFGGRVGYNRIKTSFDDGNDDPDDEDPPTPSGFFVAPTVGGSYFFSDFFSIGGEVEARYSNLGVSEEDEEFTTEESLSTISLRPALVVRFYF